MMNYWSKQASALPWSRKWDTVLNWNPPYAHWFAGGMLNASQACIDIHMHTPTKHKIALHWEDEQQNKRSLTYAQLYTLVNRYASVLKNLGITKGDIVVVYLPMIPETIAFMLAIVRLGATHSVVFSGFSSIALQDRINDAKAKMVITADVGFRRGKSIFLKQIVDQAVTGCPSVKHVLTIQRDMAQKVTVTKPRDVLLHEQEQYANDYIEPVPVESNHPLYILYTSGTTGKPKGIIHSTGGYLTYVYATFKTAFEPDNNTVYWCTADVGWVTGHSYVVYAPLMHGVTSIIYEGAPDFPHPGRWWEVIQDYKVTTYYTSPTALRMAVKYGHTWPARYNLTSLQCLGSVGEVLNPDVWKWYNTHIGGNRCPIIDTWWQTETGGFMIAPRACPSNKPGSVTQPLPFIAAEVVDTLGNAIRDQSKGYLIIKQPWPGMMIGIHNDPARFQTTYWDRFPGCYFSGDYARQDTDGDFWLLGRADEVLNISGHRIGTAEIENAAVSISAIAEAAAIGVHDNLSGQAVVIFAVTTTGTAKTATLQKLVINTVREEIGRFVTPRNVYLVDKLPKTRSGKIMRRLLKAVVEGLPIGDTSTLEDETSLDEARRYYQEIKQTVHENMELSL